MAQKKLESGGKESKKRKHPDPPHLQPEPEVTPEENVEQLPPTLSHAPGDSSTRRLRQASLLQLQRRHGNAFVQRYLARYAEAKKGKARGHDGELQRQTAGAATSKPTLIVEDEVEGLQPGQMRRSEFLAQLRESVCQGSAEALKGTIYSSVGCPYIERMFARLANRRAEYIERGILKYEPAASGATSAKAYLAPVTKRVQAGIAEWLASGKVTGVPAELAALGSESRAVGGSEGGVSRQVDESVQRLPEPVRLQAQLKEGQPLEGGTRARFERALGSPLGDVRIHADGQAARLARQQDARAFTLGQHVVFGAGEFRPGTPVGDAILAHEMAHVVQQRGAREVTGSMSSTGSVYRALEEEADASTMSVLAALYGGSRDRMAEVSRDAEPRLRTGLSLQRCLPKYEKRGEEDYIEGDDPYNVKVYSDPDIGTEGFVGMSVYFNWMRDTGEGKSYKEAKTEAYPRINRWVALHPETEEVKEHRTRPGAKIKFTKPGAWRVAPEILVSDKLKVRIWKKINVVSPEEFARKKLKDVPELDYVKFRVGLELKHLEMAKGGVQKQRFGKPHISSNGDNPAEPKGETGLGKMPRWDRIRYTIHPSDRAKKFRWYVICDNWDVMPAKSFYGHNRKRIGGVDAFELKSTAKTASWPIARPNVYTIVAEELDDRDRPLGTLATYKQVVLGSDQLAQVKKWRKYMKKSGEKIAKIQSGKEVGLRATYVSADGGHAMPLALFIGPETGNKAHYKLVDLTPGAEKTEFSGTKPADAVDHFKRKNEYPNGAISLEIPANKSGIKPLKRSFAIKRKESTWSKWSRRTGWASIGLTVAGFVALFLAPPAAPWLFSGAAVTGGTSSALSLVDRIQKGKFSKTGIAIDILGIVSSILGTAGAARMLRSGAAVALGTRAGRFLVWTEFSTDTLSGVLIGVEGAQEIANILDSDKLTRSEKTDALVQVLGRLAVTGGLVGLSAKDLKQRRAGLSKQFENVDAKQLSKDSVFHLSNLHPDALEALKLASREELEEIMVLVRQNPTKAEEILRQYTYKRRKLERGGGTPEKGKANVADQLKGSLEGIKVATARGYPYGFKSEKDFKAFIAKVRATLREYGIPDADVGVHGSAVHKSTPGDIDIAIRVDQATFDKLTEAFRAATVKDRIKEMIDDGAKKGKIAAFTFPRKGGVGFIASIMDDFKKVVVDTLRGAKSPLQISLVVKGGEWDIGPYIF